MAMKSRTMSKIFASTASVNGRTFWTFRKLKVVTEVAEMRQDIKTGFADVTTSIAKVNQTLREFRGFTDHLSKSMEQEVVMRVHKALVEAGLQPRDPEFSVPIHDREVSNTLCSPDGLIGLGDGSYAVVEVGHWVSSNLLAQMKHDVEEMTRVGYRVSYKFIGGPAFELPTNRKRGAMERALGFGYAVVYPTGSRYEVVYPPGPVPHPWPKGTSAPLSAPIAPLKTI